MRRLLLTLLTLTSLTAAARQPAPGNGSAPPAAKGGTAPAEGGGAPPAEAAPAQPPPGRYLDGMGRTPEDEARLRELSADLQRYEDEARDFRREVQLLVERKYEEKRSGLAASYEKAISELEIKERKERLDAIARFEEFLRRYPKEPRYSPDVMFRLAELYYERSSDEHLTAMREHEERLKALPENAEAPPEPQVDFAPSIALYIRLINDFRDYRFNDAAWYLLGYCYEKQNQFDESRATYETLIATYPKSRFATEAHVRIGEYWFDNYSDPTALEQAAKSYRNATEDKTHPLYDKALYKLGWTYYRMDKFSEAVESFLTLADFYEAQK